MNHCEFDLTSEQPIAVVPEKKSCGQNGHSVPDANLPTPAAAGTDRRLSSPSEEYSGVTLYWREIGRIKRLTRAEEAELTSRHLQGDLVARDRLITANLRLVVAIARRYEGFGLPLLDLISEGNIALTTAVDRFDPNRGATLATYAFGRIRSAVTRAISNFAKTVRLPVNVYEQWGKLRRAEIHFRKQFDREASVDELAEHLDCSAARVSLIRTAVLRHVSLDEQRDDDGEMRSLLEMIQDDDLLSPSDELERRSGTATLRECLKRLRPAEAETLIHRFGLHGDKEMTLEAIGQRLGVTREGVRQIERRALKKLRKLMRHTHG